MPITGFVVYEVEADKEALKEFYEECPTKLEDYDYYEWEMHRHLTRGNVLYASLNDYYVQDV